MSVSCLCVLCHFWSDLSFKSAETKTCWLSRDSVWYKAFLLNPALLEAVGVSTAPALLYQNQALAMPYGLP